MSANLPTTSLAENQNSPEISINDNTGILDAALTEIVEIDLSAGNVVLTNLQSGNSLIKVIGATVAGRTLTLPAIKRRVVILSVAANTASFNVLRGTASLTVAPAQGLVAQTDGTANGLLLIVGLASGGVSTFLALTDTPDAYAAQGGKAIRVNAASTALEFYIPTDIDTDTFLELLDTPDTYTAQGGKFVAVKADLSGLEFAPAPAGGGGATTFLALTDTPDAYTGLAGKVVAVNVGATGLEFITAASGGGSTTSTARKFRYYRHKLLNAPNGNSTISLATVKHIAAGVEVVPTASTAYTTLAPSTTYGPQFTYDGDANTFYHTGSGAAGAQFIEYTFALPFALETIEYVQRISFGVHAPTSVTIQGSLDGLNWINLLVTQTVTYSGVNASFACPTGTENTSFVPSGGGTGALLAKVSNTDGNLTWAELEKLKYRYYRHTFGGSASGLAVALGELEHYVSPFVKQNPIAATASSTFGAGYEAALLFNGNYTDSWHQSGNNPIGEWVQYDYGAAASVTLAGIRYRVSDRYTQRPTIVTVAGSNDGVTFTTLFTSATLVWDGTGDKAYADLVVSSGTADLFKVPGGGLTNQTLAKASNTGGDFKWADPLVTGTLVNKAWVTFSDWSVFQAFFPFDDTIPQITEGNQVISAAITPKSTTNKIRATVNINASLTAVGTIIVGLFRVGQADALKVGFITMPVADHTKAISFDFEHVPGSTATQTYTVRLGSDAGFIGINGVNALGGRKFGGSLSQSLSLEEINPGGVSVASHAHAQADITNLVTDLAAKAPLVHTLIQPALASTPTPAGTTQATATLLSGEGVHLIQVTAAGSGVRLPPAVAGMNIVISNIGANPLLVYPSTGQFLADNNTANTSLTVPIKDVIRLRAYSANAWMPV